MNFLILTETWQAGNIPNKLDVFKSSLLDYAEAESLDIKLLSRPRCDGRIGGGVALLFQPQMKFSYYCINFPKPSSFEMLPTKCSCNTPFILICIYRSSSDSFATFKHEFESLLSCLLLLPFPTILGGDFNVHINLTNDPDATYFLSLLAEYNYIIFAPSTATCSSGNTLDFLVVPISMYSLCLSVSAEAFDSSSDHFPVLLHLDLHIGEDAISPQARRCRAYRTMNNENFTADLQNCLSTINGSSFVSYLNNFNSSLTSLLDEHAPFRVLQARKRDNAPWMDQEYISQRSLRKRLQNTPNKAAYNAQKRHCAYLAKMKRTQYYSSSIDNIPAHDQKQLYRGLNKLCGKSKNAGDLPSHSDPVHLANSFNHFFVQKVSTIRAELQRNSTAVPPQANYQLLSSEDKHYELNNFHPTDADEILNIIKKHGIKTGPSDPFPAFLIEEHLEKLMPHLVNIVNLSLLDLRPVKGLLKLMLCQS